MKYLVGVYLSRDQVTFSNSDFTYFRVRDFEYTTECIIFDLLHISLYHGWLVDPQNPDEVGAVGKCSYNQLVEKIIGDKTSEKPEEVSQGNQ